MRDLLARLRRRPEHNRLRSFEAAKAELGAAEQVYLGRMEVPISEITGSVARHRDFDRTFLPRKPGLEERWKKVYRAARGGAELPPVNLYRIGDRYFVEDGNHRISVIRHGHRRGPNARITAEVVALLPRQSLPRQFPPRRSLPEGRD